MSRWICSALRAVARMLQRIAGRIDARAAAALPLEPLAVAYSDQFDAQRAHLLSRYF